MINTMKEKIAVIFGGKSAEHDVSIITAHNPIIDSLKASGDYDIYPIYISKDGSWYSNKEMLDIEYFKDPNFKSKLKKEKEIQLSFDDGLKIIKPGFIFSKKINIDLAFPAMHGTYGEDGSLMGLLRMADIPFVGCDIFSSTVAMDKVLTKQVLEAEDIPIVPYEWFTKHEWESNKDEAIEKINELNYPLFVKPPHLGSSIAISKVKEEKDLEDAIELALHYDNKVLIEESIEDLTEVTLPIIGNDELEFGGIEEPKGEEKFFDFKKKYMDQGKQSEGVNAGYSEIPANISEKLSHKVKHYGEKTYKILGCSGIARVDFLIDRSDGIVYVNEVNTLPGSLYQHNWKEVGVSNLDLVEKLIKFAKEKHKERQETNFTFKSNILQKAGGQKINKKKKDEK